VQRQTPRHLTGLAGGSVFHGIEGFGASSILHATNLLSMSEELPVRPASGSAC